MTRQESKSQRARRRRRAQLRRRFFIVAILFVILLIVVIRLFPKYYSNKDFDIEDISSMYDGDGDGVDDQTDFLQGVKDYVATKPEYKSVYYETGYSNDKYGVCTDVIANGYLAAGYDIMQLVNEDIENNPRTYNITEPDSKIDFRRVRNLEVYLQRNAQSLTTDIYEIDQWQGGDIVVFEQHIGVISDHRNSRGITYVIHHGSPNQDGYEQDILEIQQSNITGHYRLY